jgi:hypothetical protein
MFIIMNFFSRDGNRLKVREQVSGRLPPPADDRPGPLISNPLSLLDLPYPGPQPGSMVNNQRDAVARQDVVRQAIEMHGLMMAICIGLNSCARVHPEMED